MGPTKQTADHMKSKGCEFAIPCVVPALVIYLPALLVFYPFVIAYVSHRILNLLSFHYGLTCIYLAVYF